MSDIAIHVQDVTKIYKLYDKPTDRMKDFLNLPSKKQRYKEHFALRNLSFDVKKGECVGFIGTNGAGKSTILKIITGVSNPTSGEVVIDGRISALLELGAGFNMEYTGLENVYLNGMMIGFTREEINAKLDDILTFADIGDFIHQPVRTYSSGMFVRLAFAIAINIDPEILIVDEALSVGDVYFQSKCYKKFEDFKKQGKTIVFVSHDLSSISKYCDRVILLNKGQMIDSGAPNDMIDAYKQILVGQYDFEKSQVTNQMKERAINDIENSSKDWMSKLSQNPDMLVYGDLRAEIADYAVLDANGRISNSIEKGTPFSIRMKIRIRDDVKMPIFAFSLKDIKGTEITGTNTLIEKIEFETKEEMEVTFKQTMSLQGGEYLLSLGCTGYENGEFVVYHRLYDVCNITVVSSKNTVGFYDMDSEITVV